jgi:hypothetical protein
LQQRKATGYCRIEDADPGKKELADGLSLQFGSPDQVLDKLIDFVKAERLCCDFSNFQITVEEISRD